MKNLAVILISIIFMSAANPAYSQKKGQIHLGVGSGLFNLSTTGSGVSGTIINSTSSTSTSLSFLLGFFTADNLRIDGGLSINALGGSNAAIYANIGARYFYSVKKKITVNGGISANLGVTSGTTRYGSRPVNLSITPVEFQYWPFEGGALAVDLSYTRLNINQNNRGQNSIGINIGLLIRVK